MITDEELQELEQLLKLEEIEKAQDNLLDFKGSTNNSGNCGINIC